MTVARKVRKGWVYLTRTVPLPEGKRAVLKLRNVTGFSFKDGRKVRGIASLIGDVVEVTIATRGADLESLASCLAHEYMHCIQFLRDGKFPKNHRDLEFEVVAEIFAFKVKTHVLRAMG